MGGNFGRVVVGLWAERKEGKCISMTDRVSDEG